MAHSYTIESGPVREVVGQQVYTTWTILETDVDGNNQAHWWMLDDLPPHYTITLFESEIVSGATSVNPALGKSSTWVPGTQDADLVADNGAPVPHLRATTDVPVSNDEGTLFGWTRPAGSSTNQVRTRITITDGRPRSAGEATATFGTSHWLGWTAVDDQASDPIPGEWGSPVTFSRTLAVPANSLRVGDTLKMWVLMHFQAPNASGGSQVDGILRLSLAGNALTARTGAAQSTATVTVIAAVHVQVETIGAGGRVSVAFFGGGAENITMSPFVTSSLTLDMTEAMLIEASWSWEHGDITDATATQTHLAAAIFRDEARGPRVHDVYAIEPAGDELDGNVQSDTAFAGIVTIPGATMRVGDMLDCRWSIDVLSASAANAYSGISFGGVGSASGPNVVSSGDRVVGSMALMLLKSGPTSVWAVSFTAGSITIGEFITSLTVDPTDDIDVGLIFRWGGGTPSSALVALERLVAILRVGRPTV